MPNPLSGGRPVIPQPSFALDPVVAPLDPVVAPLSENQIKALNRDLLNWANSQELHVIAAMRAQTMIFGAVLQNSAVKEMVIVFPGEPRPIISLLDKYHITATVVPSGDHVEPPAYPEDAPPDYQELQPRQHPAERPGYEAEMNRRASLGENVQAGMPGAVADAPPEVAPNAVLAAVAPPLDGAAPIEALRRRFASRYSPENLTDLKNEIRNAMHWVANPAVSDMVKLRELSVLVTELAGHGPGEHQHVGSGIDSIFRQLLTQLPVLEKAGQAPLVPEMTRTIHEWQQGFMSRIAAMPRHDIPRQPSPDEGEPQPPGGAAPIAARVAPDAIAGAGAQPGSLEDSFKALIGRVKAGRYSPPHRKALNKELDQFEEGLSSPATPDNTKLKLIFDLVDQLPGLVDPLHGDLDSASVVAIFFKNVSKLPLFKQQPQLPPAIGSGINKYLLDVRSRHEAREKRELAAAERARTEVKNRTPDANGVSINQRLQFFDENLMNELHACLQMFERGQAERPRSNTTRISNLIALISSKSGFPHLQLETLERLSRQLTTKPVANPNESDHAAKKLWPILRAAAEVIVPQRPGSSALQSQLLERLMKPHSYSV